MSSGNKIKERIEIKDFLEILKEYSKEEVICTNHTFFRLSEKQRKINIVTFYLIGEYQIPRI